MLGYREVVDVPSSTYDTAEHSRREHGVTAAAAPMVANSWCQSCKKNFRSRSRIIHHLQYGALACRLMFASGTMILPDPEEVEAYRLSEASARACDSRKGRGHTVGFPAFFL